MIDINGMSKCVNIENLKPAYFIDINVSNFDNTSKGDDNANSSRNNALRTYSNKKKVTITI